MKAIPIGVCCIKKVVADDMKSATTWKSTTILIEYARFCRVHFELLLKRSNHFSHSAYTFFVLRPFCI